MRRTLELDGIRILAEEPDGWDGRLSIILAHGAGQNMDSPFMTFFHEGRHQNGVFGHSCIDDENLYRLTAPNLPVLN